MHKTNCFALITTAGFATSLMALYMAYKAAKNFNNKKLLRRLIEQKKATRKNNLKIIERLVEEKSAIFDPSIVNLEFNEMRERLQQDQLTPVEVLLAFQKRALKAHELTNCVVEFLVGANKWAEELTQKYHKTGAPKPYLYGIPISVKETFKIKGHDITVGLSQLINKPVEEDCWLVSGLKTLGAIPFVLTNVPQTMLSIGSSNPVFGTTRGPFDPNRSPGGSSSGEAALLALNGSPLGLGTDIGGSVRIPAHFCGIYSLKPTIGRLSQQGRVGTTVGIAIKSTAGPMAPSIQALVHCCRALWNNSFTIDSSLAPVPMNEDLLTSTRPLLIGYYKTDHLVEPLPVCQRAVEQACDILRSRGHQVVPFEPYDPHTFIDLYKALILPDNGRFLKALLDHDLMEPSHAHMFARDGFIGNFRRILFGASGGEVLRKPTVGSVDHFQKLCTKLANYQYEFTRRFRDANLECLICPVSAVVAPGVLEPPKMFLWGWTYCALFNLLDYPAGVAPCVLCDEEDEVLNYANLVPRNPTMALVHKAGVGAGNLPTGVQVVAAPYREEICLRVMTELQSNAEKVRMELRKKWPLISSS